MPFKKIEDHFYQVRIHVAHRETVESIKKYVKRINKLYDTESLYQNFIEAGAAAFVTWIDAQNIMIGFLEEKAYPPIVVHEIFHLVFEILQRKGFVLTNESQEAYAYYMQFLFKKIIVIISNIEDIPNKIKRIKQ
jgi:hypothetical protein